MQRLYLNFCYLLLFFLFSLTSCVTHSELLNFSQGVPFSDQWEDIPELPELQVQPDDLLSIKVQDLETPEVVAEYNIDPITGNFNNLGGGGIRPLIGYLVDREGYITFPVLGRLKIIGMTTSEVRELIISRLKPNYLKDPIVTVRYLNFRVTVLGEVKNPGTFTVSTERVSILDVLGLAGDLQPYANRANILITREENGRRQYGRINLQDRSVFDSPFFFLQQNDFIYVEPLPEKTASLRDQTQRVIPYISAGITVITFILTITNLR